MKSTSPSPKPVSETTPNRARQIFAFGLVHYQSHQPGQEAEITENLRVLGLSIVKDEWASPSQPTEEA